MEKSAKEYRELASEQQNQMEVMAQVVEKEGRAFSQDELEKYDGYDAKRNEYISLAESQERIERLGNLRKYEEKPILHAETKQMVTKREVDLAFRAFALVNTEVGLTDDMKRAADKMELNLNANTFTVKFEQTVGDGTEGGYTTNDSIYSGIDTALKNFGGVRSVSNVLQTGTGETIHIATVDDTSNLAVAHTENATISNVDVTFGRVQLGAFSFATAVYPVSYELLQDSQFPMGQYLGERIGERIARKKSNLYTVGAGTTEPTGFTIDTVSGSTCVVDAMVADDLYDLYFSVDQAYRNSPSCAWMMNDNTLSAIVGIEDTTGRPLWGSGLNQSPGSVLLGKRIVINNDMASMAAGQSNKVVAFGDWSKFYIREVGSVVIRRLDERYAEKGAVGFVGLHRCDSKLIDAGQNPLKHMAATDSGS